MPITEGTLFHLIPIDVRGDQLLPLNKLRSAHPDLYERHAAKHHIDEPIPPLNCTWGDVVFLSPVDSTELFDALAQAGRACRQLQPSAHPGSTPLTASSGSCDMERTVTIPTRRTNTTTCH